MKLSLRIWILIICLLLALIAISPRFDVSGVVIKNVKDIAKDNGLTIGEKIISINSIPISTVKEFEETLTNQTIVSPVSITLVTEESTVTYKALEDLKFTLNESLVIQKSNISGISDGEILKQINDFKINNYSDFEAIQYDLLPTKKLEIKTNKRTVSFLINKRPDIEVEIPSRTNIQKGLDLAGGTRVLLKPVADNGTITDKDIQDLIAVMRNKMNVYGLSDIKIRASNDLSGNKYILIELTGATKSDIEEFIIQQGKFEAKIGEDLVFSGGKKNIPNVCRDDGTCSGIRDCNKVEQGYMCTFEFAIKLSPEAAQRHAEVTGKLDINTTESGQRYLSKQIDFYLDEKLVDSLNIGEDLKGQPTTDIAISGPGFGESQQVAYEAAIQNMNQLQTVLISGSLPYKLEIVKIDTVSAIAGAEFIKNALKVALVAFLAVISVIYIRYRNIKVLLATTVVLFSELFITLGVASAIKWNIDLAAIAGIIAAIGTGVDDQIVITDEILAGEKEGFFNWKEKIKRAFFIILAAFFTTFVAMLPLIWAGAGLLRGFAVTTIIGITIGVFITRPAFAAILEKLIK